MMQPYLDRVSHRAERAEAESHLDECTYCRAALPLRGRACACYVRQAVEYEPMPVELKTKLAALRTPLE